MRIGRAISLVVLVVAAATATTACDRVVDLTPPPDAAHGDAASSADGGTDSGSFDGGTLPDAGSVPDGFTGD